MSHLSEVADDRYGQQTIRTWEPAAPARARIVIVHGLGEHSGRYEGMGELLAEAGFSVVAPDLFGFGRSGGRRGDIIEWTDFWRQIEPQIGDEPGVPTVLMGFSMGGLIALGYALSGAPQPQLVVLSAPALGGGALWQKALAPVLARLMPKALVPNSWSGPELSRDPAVGEAYYSDPMVLTKTSARLGAALFAAQNQVSKSLQEWQIPTLVLHGGADTIVPPDSTVAFGDCPGVERRLYPKLRHEVFNEPEGTALVADVISWVSDRL